MKKEVSRFASEVTAQIGAAVHELLDRGQDMYISLKYVPADEDQKPDDARFGVGIKMEAQGFPAGHAFLIHSFLQENPEIMMTLLQIMRDEITEMSSDAFMERLRDILD